MMHTFLSNNRDELVARCASKVAAREHGSLSDVQQANGIPMVLEQLTRTLRAEEEGRGAEGVHISGVPGDDGWVLSEIGTTASAHGASLLALGYTVDRVVHDYGDLCQAITDLAFERDAPFAVDEFRTLNRCLDNAIAAAVLEFTTQKDARSVEIHHDATRERIGFLVHELRNGLSTAVTAVGAMEHANLSMSGSTGAVLKRSLRSLTALVDQALGEVRAAAPDDVGVFSVESLLADAEAAARLDANAVRCKLVVLPTTPALRVRGNRVLLLGALANLLQNAFKFTLPHTVVTLIAHVKGTDLLIEVEDHCGGLPHGGVERIFAPFTQRSADRSGLGLGLSIARRNVERQGGGLSGTDRPGVGCVFTISMPLVVDAAA